MTPRLLLPGAFLVAVAFGLQSHAARAHPANSLTPAGDYQSVPVFYERYHAELRRVGDELELLRQGRVRLQHYPPVDVTNFDWASDSFTGYTWQMQMQDLRFLLPAIAATSAEDNRIARAWFMRWYAVHMVPEPATARWGEPITIAYRAMVLVWLLKREEQRTDPDPVVVEYIRATILAHQRDLIRPERFKDLSNPGFIAALGLFETTRVFPDSTAARIAITRLEAMMARAVSEAGVEREQSPAYHFVVLQWLEQMTGYFGSLPDPPQRLVSRMSEMATRMRRAGYFLQDHAGRLAPIGDTDSVMVDARSPGHRVRELESGAATLYDPASGYAVYKGSLKKGDCRYLVFRIPDERLEMRDHLHSDALAVFLSHAGETILGDAGRYSYASSPARAFMTSERAHNTVLSDRLGAAKNSQRFAFNATELPGPGTGWSASVEVGPTMCTRFVRIPEAKRRIEVVDSLQPLDPGSSDSGDVVVLWNLGSDVTGVTPVGSGKEHVWTLATRNGQRIRLALKADGPGGSGILAATLVRGQHEPLLGWYSPAQGVLRPVTALVVRVRRDPTVSVTTQVTVEETACTGPRRGSAGQ